MRLDDLDTLTTLTALLEEYLTPYGRPVNAAVIRFWAKALAPYELPDIRRAFEQHVIDRDEGKFPPMPAHLIAYLPSVDGRPDGEVLWPLLPFSESEAAFLPSEAMAAFWNTVYPALEAGKSPETVRPFFLREYARLVKQSRDRGEPMQVEVTLGHRGPAEHTRALQAAVKAGAIPLAWAQKWSECHLISLTERAISKPRLGGINRLALALAAPEERPAP